MRKYLLMGTATIAIAFVFGNLYALPQSPDGKAVYTRKCARCHGDNGEPQKKGVTDLRTSDLTDAEALDIITNGEEKMPAFKKKLTPEEIKAVAAYAKKFRK